MFGNRRPRIGQELLDVPMGDMIRQMAFAIAEAQIQLDQNSIDVAEMMGGLRTITDDLGNVTFEDSRVFFGNELVQINTAIALHNSSEDVLLKNEIRKALGEGNYTPNLEVHTDQEIPKNEDISTDKALTYNGMIYVKNDDGTSDPATAISFASFQIAQKGSIDPSNEISLPRRISMMELGFTPTFYQFVDTIIEVKISIKYTQEGEIGYSRTTNNRSSSASLGIGFGRIKGGRSVQTSQVNATYSQKYSYSAEGSSLLRTKLVPIPPPAVLEQRIQMMLEQEITDQENSN